MRKNRIMFYSRKTYNFYDITDKIKRVTALVVSLLITAAVISTYYNTRKTLNKVERIPQEVRMMVIDNANKFTKTKFISEIKRLNLKFPHIVFAQAVRESGFKSAIFIENNNMFGMKQAMNRPTTSTGVNRNHATFDTWRDCLIDYSLYQSTYLRHIKTEEQYYQYLKSYAEDPNYSLAVREIANKFKKYFKS